MVVVLRIIGVFVKWPQSCCQSQFLTFLLLTFINTKISWPPITYVSYELYEDRLTYVYLIQSLTYVSEL
jgi:hypothetical protein